MLVLNITFDFNENYRSVEKMNLGKIAKELKNLDYSDDLPELTEQDYDTIDKIREIRNYWCHQCYLDYIYIQNDAEREREFQKIANRLHHDEFKTYDLFNKTEKMRIISMNK